MRVTVASLMIVVLAVIAMAFGVHIAEHLMASAQHYVTTIR